MSTMTSNILQLIKNTYLGFTVSRTPTQKAKIENVLDSLIRYNDVIMTNKEWVYSKLLSGAYPAIEENYTYYSSRTNSMTKPKTLYKIEWQQVNHNNNIDTVYNEVNKTLYDFACHIVNNDFLNPAILEQFLAQEQQAAEQLRQQEEAQQQAELAQIEQEKQAEEQYQQWLNEQIQTYNSAEKVELYLSIFNDTYSDRPATEKQAKQFLVLVDNIDNPHCKQALKDRLHIGNTVSKKIFYHITGIKLPSTNKGTEELLDNLTVSDYLGMIAYKVKNVNIQDSTNNAQSNSTQTKTSTLKPFHRYINGEGYVLEHGRSFKYEGLELFYYRNTGAGSKYWIIESKSGMLIARGDTQEEARKNAIAAIDKNGIEKVNRLIAQSTDKNGISPSYNSTTSVEQEKQEEVKIQTSEEYFNRTEQELKSIVTGNLTVEQDLFNHLDDNINIKRCNDIIELEKEKKRLQLNDWFITSLIKTVNNEYVILAV